EMAMPVICSDGVTPCQPMNCRRRRASSSEVRSATVTMRQWSIRSPSLPSVPAVPAPSGPKRPITVWVLPTSMASSMKVSAFLFQVEGDVEDGRRVGEGPDGDEVGAGGGDGVERDPARHLDGEGAAGDAHGPGDVLGSHVVDEHEVGAGRLGLRHLVEGVALHLDGDPGPAAAGPVEGFFDRAVPEVVVFDEDGVGQVAPVVGAAAGPDGGLLQGPEAGGRLAGVADAAAAVGAGGVDVGPGEGGDPGQVAEEVERRPFPGEERAERAGDGADALPGP